MNLSYFYLFFISLFLLHNQSYTQNNRIEKLMQIIEAEDGDMKTQALLDVSYYLQDYNINKTYTYTLEALTNARKTGNKRLEKYALTLMGRNAMSNNHWHRAIDYFRQSQAIEISGCENEDGFNYTLWANCFKTVANVDSAVLYYNKALPLLEKRENSPFLQFAYISMASFEMSWSQFDKAKTYLNKALKLAKQSHDSLAIAAVLIEQGQLEQLSDNFLVGKNKLIHAETLISDKGFSRLKLLHTYYLGQTEYDLGNFNTAVLSLIKGLEMPEIAQYEPIKASMFALLGEIHIERGNYDVALKYILDAIKIMERLEMNQELCNTYSVLGWLYFKEFNDAEAVNFTKKGLVLAESIQDKTGMSHAYSVLGSLSSAQKNYANALKMHNKALEIRQAINSRYGISQSLYNIGSVYEKLGEIDRAIFYTEQTLQMDVVLGNIYNVGLSEKKLASLYLTKGNYELARKHLNTADSCALNTSSLELKRDVGLLMADLYEKQNDMVTANHYLRQVFKVNDSLYNVVSLEKTAEIRGVFDLENIEIKSKQKEQQISLQNIAMESQKNKSLSLTIILGLVSMMLIIIFVFFQISQKKNSSLNIQIKERAKAEQALRDSKEELVKLFDNLAQKNEELETTSKYKSEFLANMSHELRTPLNSILILAKVLEDNKSQNLTSKQIEFAKVIQKSGTDLLRIINDILDLSKLEVSKIEMDISKHKVSTLIENIDMVFTPLAIEKEINFNIALAANTPHEILTDLDRLDQIIKNLLSNAFKFTPKQGSVLLSIQKVDKKNLSVLNDLTLTEELLEISIKDTGIGIPKEKHEHIFLAFQQADGSTQRKYGGTGLGLSISKEFTRLLGGNIILESEAGKGATFSVYLPTITEDCEIELVA